MHTKSLQPTEIHHAFLQQKIVRILLEGHVQAQGFIESYSPQFIRVQGTYYNLELYQVCDAQPYLN